MACASFKQRASGIGMSGARHATDAINAILNVAYAREAGRIGAALAASGACLAIGPLHQDKPHRHSLVFDALEPLRPLIDAKVRAFIEGNVFDRGDFLRLPGGHVRMVPGFSNRVAIIFARLSRAPALRSSRAGSLPLRLFNEP